MSKIHTPLKIASGAVGAAAMLLAPANMAAADDYASPSITRASAVLGAPSRLAMIAAQQEGGSAPMAAPAPLKITEATAQPLARTIVLASAQAPAPAANPYLQRAVLTRPAVAPAPARAASNAPDLFGSRAIKVSSTRLDSQWRRVSRGSAEAPQTLTRIAHVDRDAQLREVNGWVNRAIAFNDDLRTYGQRDHWASAQESLRRGVGDCEDYAIAKMQILRAAGVPQRDLHLVIVRDLVRRQDHAVLAVRNGDGFVILDSNTDKVLPAEQVRDYRPIMTFNADGAWIHGYAAPQPQPQPQIQLASAAGATGGSN